MIEFHFLWDIISINILIFIRILKGVIRLFFYNFGVIQWKL